MDVFILFIYLRFALMVLHNHHRTSSNRISLKFHKRKTWPRQNKSTKNLKTMKTNKVV